MDSKLTNSKTFTSTIHCRKGRKELVGDAFDIFDIYCMYMYASLLAKLLVALVGKTRSRCRVHTLLCYFSSCPCFLLLCMQNNLWTLLLVNWAVTLMISEWSRNLFIWIVLLAEYYLPYCLYQLVTKFCAIFGSKFLGHQIPIRAQTYSFWIWSSFTVFNNHGVLSLLARANRNQQSRLFNVKFRCWLYVWLFNPSRTKHFIGCLEDF